MIIYKATNKINGKIYIGKTVLSLNRRMMFHLRSKVGIFTKALKKYGIQSFDLEIIDTANNEFILFEKEKYWIKYYNSKVPNGYNLTDGGEGMSGHSPSEETRKKMSESSKGKNVGSSNGMYGKSVRKGCKHTDEAKKKNSEKHIGKTHTEETKMQIANKVKQIWELRRKNASN